ncbi:transcription elongation factor, mitochondrial-like isoform X2 [Acanthaster planci]|uniref:Transcription elongation factor, mitochondrial-like isoform X2 n=1 Tax=Acanthaster planci TaxID=133434 RepID=A0A8B7YJQ5_ACAPL|nr:transcription elongation factor, mitochondrial-like isoform X2 [Acanthaster planci]
MEVESQASWPRLVRSLCQEASKEGESLTDNSPRIQREETLSQKKDTSDLVSRSASDEDPTKIIQLINTVSERDLAAIKHVSSNVAASIVSHRESSGPFAEVRDLLKVPGIGRQTLQRICREILKPSLHVNIGNNQGPTTEGDQFGVAASRIESLKDIVAVDIGLKHLSWVYMTRDRQVWQWRVKDIVGIKAGKWDPPTYHKMITNAIAEMPKPDLYVLEHQSYTNANKGTFQMLLYQRTLQSMLYTALNHNRDDIGTPRAISVPQTQVGRHFGLQVRGTRMSGRDIVATLLRDGMERGESDDDLPARMSWEDAETFQAATKHEKEHLANCLLLAIAFYDQTVDKIESRES